MISQRLSIDFENCSGSQQQVEVLVRKSDIIEILSLENMSDQDLKRLMDKTLFVISGKTSKQYHEARKTTFALSLLKFERFVFDKFAIKYPKFKIEFNERKDLYIQLFSVLIEKLKSSYNITDEYVLNDNELIFAFIIVFIDLIYGKDIADENIIDIQDRLQQSKTFPQEYIFCLIKFFKGLRGQMNASDVEEILETEVRGEDILEKVNLLFIIGSLYSGLDIEVFVERKLPDYYLFVNNLIQMRFAQASKSKIVTNSEYLNQAGWFYDIAVDIYEKTKAYNGDLLQYQECFRLKWILTYCREIMKIHQQKGQANHKLQ